MSIILSIAIAWGVAAPLAVAYHFQRKIAGVRNLLTKSDALIAEITEDLKKAKDPAYALLASDEAMLAIHHHLGKIYNWPEEEVSPEDTEAATETALDDAIEAGADEQVVEAFRTLRKINEPSEEAIKVLGQMRVKDKVARERIAELNGPDAMMDEWSLRMRAVDATAPKIEEDPPKED